jgi:hypothetical protein
MSEPSAPTCAHPECSEPAVRRCYFCERVCCERHITVNNGAMCHACAQTAQEQREERERAREAAAQAQSSGCLGVLALLASLLLVLLMRPRWAAWSSKHDHTLGYDP